MWKYVKIFLDSVPPHSIVGDLGCGSGRNMYYRSDLKFIGCDGSVELVKICQSDGLDVVHSNILNMPFADESFDYTICIAVLHHLSTFERRSKALNEMLRVLKPGGKMLLSVWSYEQEEDSKRKFDLGDNMVSWEISTGEIKDRYYYIFSKDTLIDFLEINKIVYTEMFNEKGNWYVIIQK
jgi:SAM-dependent methyltransferase